MRFLSLLILALTSVPAFAEVTYIPTTAKEGQSILIKGKRLHSKNNPAKILVANADDEVFGSPLTILRSSPKKLLVQMPDVSARRALILHISGGATPETSPDKQFIVVYNQPSALDASLTIGDTGQQATSDVFSGSDDLSLTSTSNGEITGETPFIFEGATVNNSETILSITDPTSDRTISLPDATGTVDLVGGNGSSAAAGAAVSVAGLPREINITGNGTIATLTGGMSGQIAVLNFTSASSSGVTVTDTDTAAVDSVNLTGTATDFTADNDDDALVLIYNGNYWIEIGRSDI